MVIWEFLLPSIVVLLVLTALMIYNKIQYPSPLVMGSTLRRICAVRFEDIAEEIEKDQGDKVPVWRLRRRMRRGYFTVNYGHFRSEITNATLFHGVLRFEKSKIDVRKSGLDYNAREVVIVDLLAHATKLRWQQFRWKFVLQLRGKLGLRIDKKMLGTAIVAYKKLEEQMIHLADMGDCWYRGMLVERLGLMDWRVLEGGESDPEPA